MQVDSGWSKMSAFDPKRTFEDDFRMSSDSKVFTFLVALALLATGVVALPIGLVLAFSGEVVYGLSAIAYGVIAVWAAMFGSNRTVLRTAAAVFLPIPFDLSKSDRRKK